MPNFDNETRLQLTLEKVIAGRPVSVVGNASSLLEKNYGHLIDAGCVIRMNAGIPIKPDAQGKKIDIHCFGTRPNLVMNIRKRRRSWFSWHHSGFFDHVPSVWMTLIERDSCDDPQQLFYPLRLGQRLEEKLGARPSTGVSVIDMLSELTLADVSIFGFDFKTSTTYYRKKENRGPHNWDAEKQYVLKKVDQNGWKIFE